MTGPSVREWQRSSLQSPLFGNDHANPQSCSLYIEFWGHALANESTGVGWLGIRNTCGKSMGEISMGILYTLRSGWLSFWRAVKSEKLVSGTVKGCSWVCYGGLGQCGKELSRDIGLCTTLSLWTGRKYPHYSYGVKLWVAKVIWPWCTVTTHRFSGMWFSGSHTLWTRCLCGSNARVKCGLGVGIDSGRNLGEKD